MEPPLDADFWVVNRTKSKGKDFFIRGVLELPIKDSDSSLYFDVWVSLSEENFKQYKKTVGKNKIPEGSPYFGWLMTNVHGYPDTYKLKAGVHFQGNGNRPFIALQPSDHQLALEQRDGITMEQVQEIKKLTKDKNKSK